LIEELIEEARQKVRRKQKAEAESRKQTI